METAVKRLARGAYQIGTGGGVRGRHKNRFMESSEEISTIFCVFSKTFFKTVVRFHYFSENR